MKTLTFIKDYGWFIKKSIPFMKPQNPLVTIVQAIPKAWGFAKDQKAWRALTKEQQEAWYYSGEGRVIEFETGGETE